MSLATRELVTDEEARDLDEGLERWVLYKMHPRKDVDGYTARDVANEAWARSLLKKEFIESCHAARRKYLRTTAYRILMDCYRREQRRPEALKENGAKVVANGTAVEAKDVYGEIGWRLGASKELEKRRFGFAASLRLHGEHDLREEVPQEWRLDPFDAAWRCFRHIWLEHGGRPVPWRCAKCGRRCWHCYDCYRRCRRGYWFRCFRFHPVCEGMRIFEEQYRSTRNIAHALRTAAEAVEKLSDLWTPEDHCCCHCDA